MKNYIILSHLSEAQAEKAWIIGVRKQTCTDFVSLFSRTGLKCVHMLAVSLGNNNIHESDWLTDTMDNPET